MSFETSLDTLLSNLVWTILTPPWLIKHLPFEGARKAHEPFVNWGQYMNELFAQKVEEAHRGYHGDGIDTMRSLVRSLWREAGSEEVISGLGQERRTQNSTSV